MNRPPSLVGALLAVVALAGVVILAQPSPSPARANVGCSVATAPAGAITAGIGAITGGAVGGGNPVGDACNSLTDGAVEAVTSPVTGALKGIGKGILGQVTSWVAEGATWLMSEVVEEIEKTTTPQLTTEGFLSEYGRMVQIASILAAAMFLLAILEAATQGSWGVLGKAIFVSVPLAFVGASIAFVLVQLALVVTDGMSHAVAVATQENSTQFFKGAISALGKAGGTAGGTATEVTSGPATAPVGEAAGATAAPLFVIFLGAIVGGFAAFFLWIEMVMRDLAVYAVALFMPLAFAVSISPRWAGVLRRYVEVLVTIIGSKFVIVSIVALAASLVSEKGAGVEHILAASGLMAVACFAPFLLFHLVLSTEAAASAAYGRRSAAGTSANAVMMAGGPQAFAGMARSNWSGPEVWSVKDDAAGASGGGGGGSGGSSGGGRPHGSGSEDGGGGGGSSGGGGEGGSAAADSPAGVGLDVAEGAAQAARSTAHHLEQSGTAAAAEETSSSSSSSSGSGAPDLDRGGDAGASAEPEGPIGGDGEESTRAGPSEAPQHPPEDLTEGGDAGGSGE